MKALVSLILLLLLASPSLGFRNIPASEIDTGNFGCPTMQQEQTVADTVQTAVRSEVQQNILPGIQCRVGECESNPATSCQDVMDRGPGVTGLYWIQRCDGRHVQVYCTMDNPCGCSGTGAWMRIGLLNMSDPTQQCPPGMGLIADPRSCSRNTQPGNCASFFFDSNFQQYSRACGRAIGYGESSPDAFAVYNGNRGYTIDDPYVDGMMITYGFSPRKHIWTFGAAVTDFGNSASRCPCSSTNWNAVLPPFIGNDWFCEAGPPTSSWSRGTIYGDNPLWDGMGCGNPSSTCCTANGPPWFCKDLPSPTRDNVEVRACGNQHQNDEDVLIALVEVYVQ